VSAVPTDKQDVLWSSERVEKYRASALAKVESKGGKWKHVEVALAVVDDLQGYARRASATALFVRDRERVRQVSEAEQVAHEKMHQDRDERACVPAERCQSRSRSVRAHANAVAALKKVAFAFATSAAISRHRLIWWQRTLEALSYFLKEICELSYPEIAVLRLMSLGIPVSKDTVADFKHRCVVARGEFKKKVDAGSIKIPGSSHWRPPLPRLRRRASAKLAANGGKPTPLKPASS
jgi:hypothetical protein